MKLADAAQHTLFEARLSYASMPILESGEGPRWQFAYDNYKHDPRPDILLLGAYRHPNTGNDLVGGVNLHYLSDDQRDSLAKILPQIMNAGNLKERYHTGNGLLPEVFSNFYRTYDSKFIRGVRKDVMYPKFGFMKTAQNWLKKKFGNVFKSKEKRQKDAEPEYPTDLGSMDDKLDQVVLQLQKKQQEEPTEPEDTPEMQAARSNFQKIMRARTLKGIEKQEDEPLIQAQADLERQGTTQGPEIQKPRERKDPREAEADFDKDRQENRDELEDPGNIINLETYSYYSPRLGRHIIETFRGQNERGWLQNELLETKVEIAQEAQRIYDEWEQDGEGYAEELGYGGICSEICNAIGEVLDTRGINWTEGGHDGDDHSYAVAYTDDEAYAVDIPASVYETGGGYTWVKNHGVQISPNDVNIIEIQRPDWVDPPIGESVKEDFNEYEGLDDKDTFDAAEDDYCDNCLGAPTDLDENEFYSYCQKCASQYCSACLPGGTIYNNGGAHHAYSDIPGSRKGHPNEFVVENGQVLQCPKCGKDLQDFNEDFDEYEGLDDEDTFGDHDLEGYTTH